MTTRRTIIGAALAAVAVLGGSSGSLGASTASTAPADVRTVETAYGPVEIPTRPQRVVAVSYDTPWQLQAVDVVPVGVQDYGRWIDEFSAEQQEFIAGIDPIGGFGEFNFEAIAALEPDLIVGDFYEIDEAAFATMSEIAPTAIAGGSTRGDWKAISAEVADFAGAGDRVDALIADYEAERDRITTDYADQLALNWVHFSLGDVDGSFSVQYPTGVVGAMLHEELGAPVAPTVPAAEPVHGYESYSVEELASILDGADVLVYPVNADGSPNPLVEEVRTEALYERLPAVVAGHDYPISTSVTDFATAGLFLDEFETTILMPLAAEG